MEVTTYFPCVFQVPQPDDSVLQGRHGVPADVRSHQPAELPQRQKLDEYVVTRLAFFTRLEM